MDPIIVGLITAVLSAIGAGVRQYLKTILTPQRVSMLLDFARAAIAGAEELGNVLDLDSAAKYEYAENALRSMAKRLGLRLSPEELNAYIHALLHQQHEVERQAQADEELLRSLDLQSVGGDN